MGATELRMAVAKWRLTPTNLARLDRLGLVRDDADLASDWISTSPGAPYPPYDAPPFDRDPIHCPTDRLAGRIREFRGPLSVEYHTGFFYDGLRLVRNSWDGVHAQQFVGATCPISRSRLKRQTIEEGVILWGAYYLNYHHFLFDFAAKVDFVERCGLPPSIPFVLNQRMISTPLIAQARDLGLFGARPIVVLQRRHWLRARRLYTVFADRPARGIAERLGARADPRRRDRLYVSRNAAPGVMRRLTNEAELVPELRARGFDIVNPAAWPLAEQVERFAAASVVVGPHGSALTNILFRAGAPLAVVEIIPDNKLYRHHFYEMSRIFGFDYRATLSRATAPNDEAAPSELDIPQTLAAVDAALAWEAAHR